MLIKQIKDFYLIHRNVDTITTMGDAIFFLLEIWNTYMMKDICTQHRIMEITWGLCIFIITREIHDDITAEFYIKYKMYNDVYKIYWCGQSPINNFYKQFSLSRMNIWIIHIHFCDDDDDDVHIGYVLCRGLTLCWCVLETRDWMTKKNGFGVINANSIVI